MHGLATALVATLILIGADMGAWAANVGSEFRVNTRTSDNQFNPAVAKLNVGFVVVWTSANQDSSGLGIYGQRYGATGLKVGAEFRINTRRPGNQSYAAVAGLKAGGFVVVWQSENQDGSLSGIYGQRYTSAGAPTGTEFRVNTHTPGNQIQPSIAALTGGGFVATWTSEGQDGSVSIHAQRYNAAGVAIGGEFRVNTFPGDDQKQSSVAALTNGGFVVVWDSYQQDGFNGGIYGQRYNSSGVAQGLEFRVNTTTREDQYQPVVAGLTNGGFVVAWSSLTLSIANYDVKMQRYNAAGTRVSSETRVNSYTNSYQFYPSIAALTDGGFLITWASYLSSSGTEYGYGVYAKRFGSGNAVPGPEFRANTYVFSDQGYRIDPGGPAVAPIGGGTTANGIYVITWPSYGQVSPTSADDIYGQRFN